MLQVSGNTLQQVEKFKYVGMVFTSDGGWNNKNDTRIGKANPVLPELYRSMVTKRELSNTAKLSVFKSVFVSILTYGHESWVMTERILSQVQAADMGFLRRVHGVTQGRTEVRWRPGQETCLAPPCSTLRSFGNKCIVFRKKPARLLGLFGSPQWFGTRGIVPLFVTPLVWHFATKCADVKFAEPWMPNDFTELRNNSYVGSALCPECPTKDWRGKSCWINPRESNPEVVQGLGGVTAYPTLLVPSWCGTNRTIWKLLLTVRYSKSA